MYNVVGTWRATHYSINIDITFPRMK